MLLEFPSAYDISNSHLTILSNLSKGKYGKDKMIALKSYLLNLLVLITAELLLSFIRQLE
ncbi:hypothetical protein VSU16_07700 [Cetobacterium somerae]|uniref:hypothetical protein n=1 Tax=Cetobacterium somerae TaxID=188913 RepID=UPI002E7C3D5C|nr:hypothetical protein [Cetobacterium somerae]WVJ00698.1 hypothetical protein VSU16_07700 [Cetobacterium somerae]